MEFEIVNKEVSGIPFMTSVQGKVLYQFIRKVKPQQCLELGCYHGVSSCYIAAALDKNNQGCLTTIDLERAKTLSPNIETLLGNLGLREYVQPIYSASGYNWELMKIIEAQTKDGLCVPKYDFCFIDGSHLWNIDGLAFFLIEKLLNPGGWILLDDVHWTIEKDYKHSENDYINSLSKEQKTTPQVKKILELLVRQHPNILHTAERSDQYGWVWGWAKKINSNQKKQDFFEVFDSIYSHD